MLNYSYHQKQVVAGKFNRYAYSKNMNRWLIFGITVGVAFTGGNIDVSWGTAQSAKCCKYCSIGKACGNGCISRTDTCKQPSGCACGGLPPDKKCTTYSQGVLYYPDENLNARQISGSPKSENYKLLKCQVTLQGEERNILWELVVGGVTLIFNSLQEVNRYINSPTPTPSPVIVPVPSANRPWLCEAKCPVQQIDPKATCPEYVYGIGRNINRGNSEKESKKDANSKVPAGCKAKHCRVTVSNKD